MKVYCGECDKHFEVSEETVFNTIGEEDDGDLKGRILICVQCPDCGDNDVFEA